MKIIVSLISFLFLTVIIVVVLIGMKTCERELLSNIEKYDELIGSQIILNKDTLMIIDYSFMKSNLILEDGRTININLVNKLEVLEKKEENNE